MASPEELDELFLKIQTLLNKCEMSELTDVATTLNIQQTIGNSKRKAISTIRNHLENMLDNSVAETEEHFNTISVQLEHTVVNPEKEEKEELMAKAAADSEAKSKEIDVLTKMLMEKETKTKEIDSLTKRLNELTGRKDKNTVLYKELKIHGKSENRMIPTTSLTSHYCGKSRMP